MQESFPFVLVIVIFGGAIIIGIIIFAFYALLREWEKGIPIYKNPENGAALFIERNEIKRVKGLYMEFMERRNEFWFGFGQMAIVGISIVIIGVLLLTEKISSEAGLPVFTGLSSFLIARTVQNRGNNRKEDHRNLEEKENNSEPPK